MSATASVAIRRASIDDAPAVAALGARIFVKTFGEANTAGDMRTYVRDSFSVDRVRNEIADSRSTVFIASAGGIDVGYAHLHAGERPEGVDGDDPVELVRLYVERTQHGTGVGAALMQTCIDAARTAGHDVMHLGVWEHNPRAIAFYRKWGFERVGEQTFTLGSDVQTDWTMRLRI